MHEKVSLEGDELAAYQAQKKEEAETQAKEKARVDRTRRLAEAEGLDESDDSSGDEDDNDAAMSVDEDEILRDVTNGRRRKAPRVTAGDAETGTSGVSVDISFFGGYSDEFIDDAATQQGGFDVYVRGQQARRPEFTVAIKGEDGELYIPSLREQQRLRLFPFIERRRRVDAYGEIVDVAGWLSRGKNEEQSQAVESSLGKRKRDHESAVKVRAFLLHVMKV